MSGLIKALLIIVIIIAGVMHGHFQWSRDFTDNETEWTELITDALNLEMERINSGAENDSNLSDVPGNDNEADMEEPEDRMDADGDFEVPQDDKDEDEPLYKPLLDDADLYIAKATSSLVLAYRDQNNRRKHVGKVFEHTDEALNILEALELSYQDNPDIEERLGQVFRIREDAMKLAPRER